VSAEIIISEYQPEHHDAFRNMNVEWLERYGLMETHDMLVLDDPKGTVLDRAGYIWMAFDGDLPIGSAAIMKAHEEGVYEIAKMAVVPSHQGRGVSKLLMEKCVEKAKEIGVKKLILFSNHQLTKAIALYEKFGFRHVKVTDSPFVTADVRMELDLVPVNEN